MFINKDLKTPLSEKDIYKSEIKLSHLKKIDNLFNKGLSYYIDPKDPKITKEESIFFRKDKFNAVLNFGSKKIVNHFEEEKISLSVYSKLTDTNTERKLKVYSLNSNPKDVALTVREELYPTFSRNTKEFLKSLINKFSEYNIVVFEFIETWNKKEKANINGFYLAPNVIVLKRQQKSLRREIFTLIHELGHYLLDEEEIDENIDLLDYDSLNKIEKWCNDFTYFFLVGEYHTVLDNLATANATNDYHNNTIKEISERTNLSRIALYTRLLINNQISKSNYKKISDDFYNAFLEKENEEKEKRLRDKELGLKKGGSTPKPIISPYYQNTIQLAFLEGVINEYEFCKRLSINPSKIERYLQ